MIKNLCFIIIGIYIDQEYRQLLPNIKNHYYHINNQLLNNGSIKTDLNKCPVMKFLFK